MSPGFPLIYWFAKFFWDSGRLNDKPKSTMKKHRIEQLYTVLLHKKIRTFVTSFAKYDLVCRFFSTVSRLSGGTHYILVMRFPVHYRTFSFFYRQERQARQDLMVFLALLAPWRFIFALCTVAKFPVSFPDFLPLNCYTQRGHKLRFFRRGKRNL